MAAKRRKTVEAEIIRGRMWTHDQLQGVVNVLEAAIEMAFEKWRTPEQQDKHFARKHRLSELDAQDRRQPRVRPQPLRRALKLIAE